MRLLSINHHYVRYEPSSGGIFPISFDELLRRLERVTKVFRPISSNLLMSGLSGENIGDALVVTFDDGLAEQAQAAFRLAALGIPSICFVPTLPIIEGCLLDVHRLHLIRSVVPDEKIAYDIREFYGDRFSNVDIEKARKQYRYDVDTARRVKFFLNFVLEKEEREIWTKACFQRYCGDERAAVDGLYMDADTITRLHKIGSIGCHGHSHVPLAQLCGDLQREDLSKAIGILQEIVGPSRIGLAYPYGGPDAADATTFAIAKELDFGFAFTMRRGVNTWPSARECAFSLARIDTNDAKDFV